MTGSPDPGAGGDGVAGAPSKPAGGQDAARRPPELVDYATPTAAVLASLRELRVLLVYKKVDAGFLLSERARLALIDEMPLPGESGWIAMLARDHFDPVQAFLEEVGKRARREDLIRRWQRNEWLLNVRMNLFFAFQSPERIAACASRMIPATGPLGPTRRTECANRDSTPIKTTYGFADVLLRSDDLLLMIEMKARGQIGIEDSQSTPSEEAVSEEQAWKYARLAEDAIPGARRNVLLVTGPEDEAKRPVLGEGLEEQVRMRVGSSNGATVACSRVVLRDACAYITVDDRLVNLSSLEAWKVTYEELARGLWASERCDGTLDERARTQLREIVEFASPPEVTTSNAP